MRVLVNGLSIGSLSGEHVVYGFLAQVTRWTADEHEFLLLHYESSPPPAAVQGENVHRIAIPDHLRNWRRRTVWEYVQLPRLVRDQAVDLLVCPSGAMTPTCQVRQVVLAQNPWCFVPEVHEGWGQRAKAALQRRAYRQAFRSADLMVYISDFLRQLYRTSAGAGPEAPSEIAYVAINDATHAAARELGSSTEKQSNLIVSVSAMARWKGAETLVRALHEMRADGIDARLRLVGPWPDAAYAAEIRDLVHRLQLQDVVEITGQVSRDQLHQHYAQARVFALMSQCESFGIPAAEAQAFGTPTVVSTGCAMPEICGDGGVAGPPGDVEWVQGALTRMLTDPEHWSRHSVAARANAQRYRWEQCARPLMSMFSVA